MRPGVNVTTRETAPPVSFPTDTGVGFMAAIVESGPTAPTANDVVHNMTEYEAKWAYSKRAYAQSVLYYDSAEEFFKEGGYALYVGRVVGTGAVTATVAITDGTNPTLNAFAKGPGDYGNDLNVVIRTNAQDSNIPVGSFRVRVQTDAAVILEESPDLLDDASAILWSQNTSKYVTLVDNAASSNDPAAGTYALTGGLLDAGTIADSHWATGIARFTADLGPGQVFAPGRTTTAGQIQLAQHALNNNRVALLDAPDTPTVATLTALPPLVIDTGTQRSRFSGMFAPWLRIPGVTTGSVRSIPPSPAVAGLMARNDGSGLSPNEPAAGANGVFNNVLSVSQTWIDSDRQTLNAAGVNVIRDMFGSRKVYGYRTTANPTTDARWIALSNSRLHRAVAALGAEVAERFMFKQIDGERRLINQFGAALIGEACMPFYLAGSLYGTTPDEAFFVDVGETVNTPTTIANNELHAVIQLRMSPFGEEIDIEIVKVLVTETIAA